MKKRIMDDFLTLILVSDKPCMWTYRRMMERTVKEWPNDKDMVEKR